MSNTIKITAVLSIASMFTLAGGYLFAKQTYSFPTVGFDLGTDPVFVKEVLEVEGTDAVAKSLLPVENEFISGAATLPIAQGIEILKDQSLQFAK